METEKVCIAEMADFDKLPKVEAKIAFISLAASALSMLDDGAWHGLPPFDQKAWEGLAWITEELMKLEAGLII